MSAAANTDSFNGAHDGVKDISHDLLTKDVSTQTE